MKWLKLLLKMPFRFRTVPFNKWWQGHVPGVEDTEIQALREQFPVSTRTRLIEKIPFLFSIAQNISVLKACLFYRPTVIPHHKKGLAYVRIHKSGSSSVISHLILSDLHGVNSLHAVEWTAYYYYLQKNRPDTSLRHFSIVRNPYARLVSAYLNSYVDDSTHHYVYGCYLLGIFRREFTFAEFVNCLNSIPAPLLLENIKTQKTVLESARIGLENIQIFKMEDGLEKVAHFMEMDYADFGKINPSPTYDYQSYYTPQLFETASRIYAEDVKTFGYEKDQEELQKRVQNIRG